MIFVSRNAVEQCLPLLPERRLPVGPKLVAIGRATAFALSTVSRAPDLLPSDRFDSESLLALPALEDMRNKRVLIVRGQGGRPLIGDTLIERGAMLAYAEVYRRALPNTDSAPLLARWKRDVQFVTATSGEVLDNLLVLIGRDGLELLLATPLVVVSERTARVARRVGFARVELADRATDEAIVAALCRIVGSSQNG
jgi:uroporphyrinogen-III synthase